MKSGTKYFTGNKKFENLNNQLIIKYDSFTVDAIWRKIGARYDGIMYKYGPRFSAVKKTDFDFLPLASVYLTLKNEDSSDALELIQEQVQSNIFQEIRDEREKKSKTPSFLRNIFKPTQKKLISDELNKLIEDFCAENSCVELWQMLDQCNSHGQDSAE